MTGLRTLRGLRRDEHGTSALEFALLLLPLSILLMGSLEVGYRIYAVSVSNGAIREAARMASTGEYTGAEIDAHVVNQIRAFRRTANVQIVKKSYSDFTGVGLPEPITSGTVASGNYCFDDVNRSGAWEEDRGRDGLGGAEDVIYYEVTATYPSLFKLSESFGFNSSTVVELNTIVSNEPFAAVVRTPPPNICV